MSENTENSIKIILLGESGVGKTNLINIFVGKPFDPNSLSSISSTYSNGSFKLQDKEYPYVLWDTAGQESYRSLNKIFMKNAKVIIFVYAIDNEKTFNELDYWIDSALQEIKGNYVMGIIGNKSDLFDDQKVTDEEAEAYAQKKRMKLKFTSAMTDPVGVKLFINELISDYINGKYRINQSREDEENKEKASRESKKSFFLDETRKKKNKCC